MDRCTFSCSFGGDLIGGQQKNGGRTASRSQWEQGAGTAIHSDEPDLIYLRPRINAFPHREHVVSAYSSSSTYAPRVLPEDDGWLWISYRYLLVLV